MSRKPPDIEMVDPSRLKPHPDNPRRIGREARARLAAGLATFGWLGPIVARREDDLVLGGHQKLDIALERKEKLVPVLYRSGLSDAEARAVLILLNNPEAQGEWDTEKLAKVLADVPRAELESTGFSKDTLTEIAPHFAPQAEGDEEYLPAVPDVPRSESGKVYELGRHRLMCGDSTMVEQVQQLVGVTRCDAFVTDPPYAIYGSSTGLGADVTDDKLVRPFFREVLLVAKRSTKEFAHVYVFCDWRSWASWWEVAKQAQLKVKNCLVWDKGDFGMGANYPNAHEFVCFLANMAPDPTMTSKRRTGQRQVLDQANMLRFPRAAGVERLHNAGKPVALLQLLIEKGTEAGQSVLDPFCGSGSTIIAAERSGRTCLALEIDPKWCDVARQRYADVVGDAKWSPARKLSPRKEPVAKRGIDQDGDGAPSSPVPVARRGRRKGADT